MSLTKILMAPMKLFKKEVITFLVIRRHDLGHEEDDLCYIAVKPNASIFNLRQKVWHLLYLPDYCEEIIILKSCDNAKIPLTELRKGNDPQHPYILEVWPASKRLPSTTTVHNMLTMGHGGDVVKSEQYASSDSTIEAKTTGDCTVKGTSKNIDLSEATFSGETVAMNNKIRFMKNNPTSHNLLQTEYKKSELTCRISSSSLLYKLQGNKSKDNFTSILLKIQSDLSNLSNKLSNLEHRIPT